MSKDKNNNIINFPQKKSKLEREVEAIIFAAEEPLLDLCEAFKINSIFFLVVVRRVLSMKNSFLTTFF